MIIGLIITLFVVIGIVVLFATMPNTSSCTGNCRQGRDCNCGPTDTWSK